MTIKRDRTTRRMDWLVFNIRWLLLVITAGVAFANLPTEPLPLGLLAALTFALFYNMALAVLEFTEYWHPFLPIGVLGLDSLLALALFITSGGSQGPLVWMGLLPSLVAAFRYDWPIALSVLLGFLLAQSGAHLGLTPQNFAGLLPVWLSTLALSVVVFIAALIAARLRAYIQALVRNEEVAETQRTVALRQHAQAIYEMASKVSASLDYKKVLEIALNVGMAGAEGDQASAAASMVSAALLFQDDELVVGSARRMTTADLRVVCPGNEGVLGQVIHDTETAIATDPGRDPELKQFISLQKCRSLMVIPLHAGYETYGVILYAHPRPNFFDADQRALLTAVVNQAIIALQNAQLYRNLRQEKERLMEVQEEAQKKLARDLHDGPTQSVAALAMRANFIRRLLERNPQSAAEELYKMEDLARRTTKEIRHMLFTLRPLVLESQGLIAALKQLAEKIKETHDQTVIVEAEPKADENLELNYQGVLFYIVEEAVNNARKHAQAPHIWVRLKTQKDVLVLEIQDDGVGFNVGAVDINYDKRGSLGMVNMRERTEMVNGALKIDSAEGKGTRITILVPLTEEARDRLRH